jgi:hypothetical protein
MVYWVQTISRTGAIRINDDAAMARMICLICSLLAALTKEQTILSKLVTK